MSVEIDFRPMQSWVGKEPEFRADRWKNSIIHTMNALKEELVRNEIEDALLETYHSRDQLKMNGLPKSGADPAKPGVQLWFKIGGMPICLSCNRFGDWHENLKAIQMTLRSRRLEREYGCASMEEQYRGHAQLPGGSSVSVLSGNGSIESQVRFVLIRAKKSDVPVESVLESKALFHDVYKLAAKNTHPDRGLDGSEELMSALNNAKAAIVADRGW